jgi:hypothetical protein
VPSPRSGDLFQAPKLAHLQDSAPAQAYRHGIYSRHRHTDTMRTKFARVSHILRSRLQLAATRLHTTRSGPRLGLSSFRSAWHLKKKH